MAKLSNSQLLLISKGKKDSIDQLRLGAHLAKVSGLTVDELHEKASTDRFRFALVTLKCAQWALASSAPQCRVALARSYYAMYHAARSVVYFVEGGDDFEPHSELPKHIPDDLPDRNRWENEIKTARLERNRADYDPYPKTDAAFAKSAKKTLAVAEEFIVVAGRYLRRKGCKL